MGFLESFLDALGRSGLLPEASGTLLDDRGELKHYACTNLEAWKGSNTTLVVFFVALATPRVFPRWPTGPIRDPPNHTIST